MVSDRQSHLTEVIAGAIAGWKHGDYIPEIPTYLAEAEHIVGVLRAALATNPELISQLVGNTDVMPYAPKSITAFTPTSTAARRRRSLLTEAPHDE